MHEPHADLRVPPHEHGDGRDDRWVDPLADRDPRDKRGLADKAEGAQRLAAAHERLAALQDRLWAEKRQALLVVLQAIDTGGKDGTVRKVFQGVNPQGCEVTSFGVPSPVEKEHDALWRYHQRTPSAGRIGIFNRSHYEEVLVVRVHGLVPEEVWRARYAQLRAFEELLETDRTRVVKVFLHISRDEQKARLQARLDDPDKRWKFSTADLAERERWDAYQAAFAEALARTSTASAPWYVVPADRKWVRDVVVAETLVAHLADMDPRYPDPPDLTGVTVR